MNTIKKYSWLLILILMINCQNSDPQPQTQVVENNSPKPTVINKYLALGDSYTIGTAVRTDQTWSYQLAKKLAIPTPEIIAQAGHTTADLLRLIELRKPNSDYDLVSLLIGVNNQYRGQSTEIYRVEFQQLLKEATRLANGRKSRVFVLSIPDWGYIPSAGRDKNRISKEIEAFNKVAQEECKTAEITFIDITPLSRQVATDGSLASDEFHFSGKMYQQWAEKAAPVVSAILRGS
jgi:lysophospholipase L1-like esterase